MTSTISHKGFRFDVYADGSGFAGIVSVRGCRFAVNYTDRANVALINATSSMRAPKWAADWARDLASEVAAQLPADWHEANRAMYA